MDANSKILQLTVTNQIDTDVTLQCTILGPPGPFTVDNLIHKIVSESKAAKLSGNSGIDFTVSLNSTNPGVYMMPVAFMFYRDGEEPFHIVKYIRAEIVDDVVARLQPKVPYIRPKPVAIVYEPDVQTERGEPPYMYVLTITFNHFAFPLGRHSRTTSSKSSTHQPIQSDLTFQAKALHWELVLSKMTAV
jgi:hypothetical protein